MTRYRHRSSAYYAGAQSYSRSRRALEAESEGRFPLTRAIPVVARMFGITRKAARFLLEERGTDEWHHVGKYANETFYYDTRFDENDFTDAQLAEARLTRERYLAVVRDADLPGRVIEELKVASGTKRAAVAFRREGAGDRPAS